MRIFQILKGQKENEGRVEFCSSGRWVLFCHNGWDNDDANVICNQLGFIINSEGRAI